MRMYGRASSLALRRLAQSMGRSRSLPARLKSRLLLGAVSFSRVEFDPQDRGIRHGQYRECTQFPNFVLNLLRKISLLLQFIIGEREQFVAAADNLLNVQLPVIDSYC